MKSAGIITLVILFSVIRTNASNHTIQGQITDLFSQMTNDTLPIIGAIVQATNYPTETDTIIDITDINGHFSILTGIEENNNIITPVEKLNSYLVGAEVNLNLYLNDFENSDLELKIFDLLGREIENKTKRAEQGKNVFNINLKQNPNSAYFYRLFKGEEEINKGKLTLVKGINKLNIDLNNEYEQNNNGAGQSSLILPPYETFKLTITDSTGQYYQRITYLTINSDTFINENMADTSLPMDFFDAVCRSRWPLGTQRRLTQCIWYVDTSAAIGSGVPIEQAWIDTVVTLIQNEIPRICDYKISGSDEFIEIGNNPPTTFPDMNGYHIIQWNDNIPGMGDHGEILDGFEIIAASVRLRTGTPYRRIYLQELSQNMGFRTDSNLYPSIFNDMLGETPDHYTIYDLKAGKFLYNRPLGNRTPDIDLAPQK